MNKAVLTVSSDSRHPRSKGDEYRQSFAHLYPTEIFSFKSLSMAYTNEYNVLHDSNSNTDQTYASSVTNSDSDRFDLITSSHYVGRYSR